MAALASSTRADIISARAELHAGGGGGVGVGGDQKDSAFFKTSPNGMYGVLVGAKILIADAYIDHTQYTDGSRITTWTQFALGFRIDVKTGAPPAEKDKPEPKPTGYFELGFHLGFGLGTGQQVMPPLDNAQLSDKAFLVEIRPGFGKLLGNGFRVGLSLPISGGYFFKSGNGATANDLSTHYQGIEAAALITLGCELGAW
ncbi:MAG TPA: hypothetical protein VL463_16975 [Kofleriaceae bacterium]|nr:hypothetical protein [Kofleriaceae bacterium]